MTRRYCCSEPVVLRLCDVEVRDLSSPLSRLRRLSLSFKYLPCPPLRRPSSAVPSSFLTMSATASVPRPTPKRASRTRAASKKSKSASLAFYSVERTSLTTVCTACHERSCSRCARVAAPFCLERRWMKYRSALKLVSRTSMRCRSFTTPYASSSVILLSSTCAHSW